MLALPHTNSWGFVYDNTAAAPSVTPGTSIIPGASDVEGDWTEVVGDASVTTDIHLVQLMVIGGRTSTASKQHFLDFGWDPAGGTSYVAFMNNLACGNSPAQNAIVGYARFYHFPCRIPAGSAIACRIQGSNATAGTVFVSVKLFGKPSRPELWRNAAYSETIGVTSGTLGTSFTPGTDDWGAWASLGTTTKKHFWAQLGVQIDNGTQANDDNKQQLAIGDGSNKHIIIDTRMQTTSNEDNGSPLQYPCTWEIPAGAELWVRGACQGAPVTGHNATAVLFGG